MWGAVHMLYPFPGTKPRPVAGRFWFFTLPLGFHSPPPPFTERRVTFSSLCCFLSDEATLGLTSSMP